mmetsp:Transcript_31621/g.68390  ORF Transcript_31621/g.68390 Transcript_31621/m.68390 type:complete len:122 (-) Transcript_31621:2662-3027(-)
MSLGMQLEKAVSPVSTTYEVRKQQSAEMPTLSVVSAALARTSVWRRNWQNHGTCCECLLRPAMCIQLRSSEVATNTSSVKTVYYQYRSAGKLLASHCPSQSETQTGRIQFDPHSFPTFGQH